MRQITITDGLLGARVGLGVDHIPPDALDGVKGDLTVAQIETIRAARPAPGDPTKMFDADGNEVTKFERILAYNLARKRGTPLPKFYTEEENAARK